jgi:hypothetical protein
VRNTEKKFDSEEFRLKSDKIIREPSIAISQFRKSENDINSSQNIIIRQKNNLVLNTQISEIEVVSSVGTQKDPLKSELEDLKFVLDQQSHIAALVLFELFQAMRFSDPVPVIGILGLFAA